MDNCPRNKLTVSPHRDHPQHPPLLIPNNCYCPTFGGDRDGRKPTQKQTKLAPVYYPSSSATGSLQGVVCRRRHCISFWLALLLVHVVVDKQPVEAFFVPSQRSRWPGQSLVAPFRQQPPVGSCIHNSYSHRQRIPSPDSSSRISLRATGTTNSPPNDEKDSVEDDSSSSSTTATTSTTTLRESSGNSITTIPMPLSILGATTSTVVAGTFYLVLCWRRDVFMVAFFVQAIVNGILSKILKRLINQQRPEGTTTTAQKNAVIAPSDGGMPSSHAMSLGFIGTVTLSQLLSMTTQQGGSAGALLAVPLLILYVVGSLWYRVRVQLHTPAQIGVGLTVGTAHGYLFQRLLQENLQTWLLHQLPFLWQTQNDGVLLLRTPYLVIPAIVGALVVGSVERRLSYWFKKMRQQRQDKME